MTTAGPWQGMAQRQQTEADHRVHISGKFRYEMSAFISLLNLWIIPNFIFDFP